MVINYVSSWSLDQIQEGQTSSIDVTINESDVDEFARLSGDISPLHMDAKFAKQRGFLRRVVHGMLLSSYISRVLGVQLPGENCLIQSINLRFIAPAYVGESIQASVTVKQISEPLHTVIFDAEIKNAASGEVLAKGKIQVGITEKKDK